MRYAIEGARDDLSEVNYPSNISRTNVVNNLSMRCGKCGSNKHTTKDCRSTELQCFYCKRAGHFQNQCPKLSAAGSSQNKLISNQPFTQTSARHDFSLLNVMNQSSKRTDVCEPAGPLSLFR